MRVGLTVFNIIFVQCQCIIYLAADDHAGGRSYHPPVLVDILSILNILSQEYSIVLANLKSPRESMNEKHVSYCSACSGLFFSC